MRRFGILAGLVLLTVAGSRSIAQDKNLKLVPDGNRIALIIGNAKYQKSPLANPVNDARSMAAMLKGLGWDVIVKLDQDKRGMKDALAEFGKKLGKDSSALFYYSGHAAEFAGQNYLIPTVFDIRKEADIADEAVNASSALYEMEECRIKIVILDACRDNPFGQSFSRSGRRGLGPMRHPTETVVFYAASIGQTADDNNSEQNGLFTSALLKYIPKPGLPIEQVFKSVASEVQRKSGKRQVPELSGTLTQDFYFVPATVARQGSKAEVVETGGGLAVTSNPPGAHIFINGKDSGRVTPFRFQYELDGPTLPLAVRLEREGYMQVTLAATLEHGKETSAGQNLKPLIPRQGGGGSARGQARVNLADGAQLVYVPGGDFTMGDTDQSDNPPHKVTLTGYYIYKNVVTVSQYRKFCTATGHNMSSAPTWGWKNDHPIVNVTWDDAQAYCKWAGVGLPTEAQWEMAARGTDRRKFPWGDEFTNSCLWSSFADKRESTAPAGSYPNGASPCGALDMAGNVWQWCADWYDANYCKKLNLINPSGPGIGTERVLRGGSWLYNDPANFRASHRDSYDPTYKSHHLGFRCVSQN